MQSDHSDKLVNRAGAAAAALEASVEAIEAARALLLGGPLRDLPAFSLFLKFVEAGRTVRDFLFAKKVVKFLTPLQAIPAEEVRKFRARLDQEPSLRAKIAEQLVLIVEQFDDMEKPELLSSAFAAYGREQIKWETFRELALAIDRAVVSDLDALPSHDGSRVLPHRVGMRLMSCGLMAPATAAAPRGAATHASPESPKSNGPYVITDLGKILRVVVLRREGLSFSPELERVE